MPVSSKVWESKWDLICSDVFAASAFDGSKQGADSKGDGGITVDGLENLFSSRFLR